MYFGGHQSYLFLPVPTSFSFGVTVEAEAGMTIHSQRWDLLLKCSPMRRFLLVPYVN